jgi:predicted enzyme related to lactoylglutathione lyase
MWHTRSKLVIDCCRRVVKGGGVFTLRRAKLSFLTIYIKVDDLDTKVMLIEENGGFIVDPPLDLPSDSRIRLFNEPSQ